MKIVFQNVSKVLFVISAIAQMIGAMRNANAQDLPKVIQPSPEAAALFRFQDYPMDYSTGLPSVSIPIYTVKSGSLSVPISISNHASGRRVSDQDGPVALGWSLNAGGMISRTIYGSADFGAPSNATYYFPYPFLTSNLSLSYLEKAIHYDNPGANILPWTDTEYDVFSYDFNGNGGKFIFKDVNNVKTPVLLPFKNYVIKPYYSVLGISAIDILDDAGVLYKFSATENEGSNSGGAVTGLALQQIISADKKDIITFKYSTFTQWRLSFSQQRTIIDKWNYPRDESSASAAGSTDYSSESSNQSYYQISRLTEIDFNQGKIMFNLVTGNDKIDNIQIINLNNEVIKTIQFNRSQLDYLTQGGSSGNPNMTQVNNKLDALVFKDKTGAAVEKYSFQYYPTAGPVDLHYCDWWGYFNASGNINMLPTYTNVPYVGPLGNRVGVPVIENITVYNGEYNREPNLAALKSGVLKKIVYPTGGSTEFIYENNKYLNTSVNQVKDGPGLRVAQSNTDDGKGNIITKSYKYGVSESGSGVLEMYPGINTMASESYENALGGGNEREGSSRQRTFYSGFLPELSALEGRPVIYTEVAEYIGTPVITTGVGVPANNIGKTVYTYDYFPWGPAQMATGPGQTIPKAHIYTFNYWRNPSMVSKTDFKAVKNGTTTTYSTRKITSNSYIVTNLEDIVGLHVKRAISYPVPATSWGTNPAVPEPIASPTGEGIYVYSEYHIPGGIKNLGSTTETTYNDDGSQVINAKTYTYNTRQYVSQVTSNTSEGSGVVLNSYIKFPFDYTGDPLLAQMTDPAVNMLNFPVEQTEFRNTASTKGIRTNYFNWSTPSIPAIRPLTVDVKKGASAYETRLHFYGYDDQGNPTSVSKENDELISYVWDYNNTYPVAEVKNAAQQDIAFTSFEADGTGNWTINSAIRNSSDAMTGKRCYDLANGSITKSSLSASKKYIISYWAKGGSRSVSGATVSTKTGRTIAGTGWTFYESTLTNPSASVSIFGTGLIDELRLYPADAQMTSYTYEPLIGQKTVAEMRGEVMYYEYDNYGRLKLIKDGDGNIRKTLNYQYQSTTP